MNALILLTMFIPPLQADYRCDMDVEVNNLCNLPVIEWYVEPITKSPWMLS